MHSNHSTKLCVCRKQNALKVSVLHCAFHSFRCVTSLLQVDITFFPFDEQHCKMKFGSWTYDQAQVGIATAFDLAPRCTKNEQHPVGLCLRCVKQCHGHRVRTNPCPFVFLQQVPALFETYQNRFKKPPPHFKTLNVPPTRRVTLASSTKLIKRHLITNLAYSPQSGRVRRWTSRTNRHWWTCPTTSRTESGSSSSVRSCATRSSTRSGTPSTLTSPSPSSCTGTVQQALSADGNFVLQVVVSTRVV